MPVEQSFGFFSDAGLTLPIVLLPFSATPGVDLQVDSSFFFGSLEIGRDAVDINTPEVGQLLVILNDTDLAQGVNQSDFVLALSQVDLDTSISQSVLLGPVVLSGTINAVEIFVRYKPPAGFTGKDTALNITLVDGLERVS